MLVKITRVTLVSGCVVHLRFNDGSEGDVDLAQAFTFDGVFEPLNDPAFFAKVTVNPDWGTLAWPGELETSPETLYAIITGKNPFEIEEQEGLVRAADSQPTP
jgi:hypothetical protein